MRQNVKNQLYENTCFHNIFSVSQRLHHVRQMLIAVNLVILHILGRNLIEQLSCTGDFRLFNRLQAQAIHCTLGLGNEENVLYRTLVKGNCPVGRVIANRSRIMEASR